MSTISSAASHTQARHQRRPLAKAGAAALGTLLLPSAARAARPHANDPAITLSFAINWQGNYNQTAALLAQQAADELAPQIGPGVRLRVQPWLGSGWVIPMILSGSGPDVFTGCCEDFASYVNNNLLLRLDPYLKRDNISASLWSAGQFSTFTLPSGQYGLPVYAGPHVFAYDQGILDDLGIAYPDDEWDYQAATKIWRAVTGNVGGQHRFGVRLSWWVGNWEGPYLVRGWGGSEMNSDHTRCELNSAPAVDAMKWLYDLYYEGVLNTREGDGYVRTFPTSGVFLTEWGGKIGSDAGGLRTNYKWRYIPYPKWGTQRATDMNADLYAINARTKHPDAAWELLKSLSGPGTFWQRFTMKTTLTPPALNGLWDEFLSIAYQAAPVLKTRNLEAFKTSALGGWGYTQQLYRYDPAQADSILGGYLAQLAHRAITPAAAMMRAASEINALEANGPLVTASLAVQARIAQVQIQRAQAAHGPVTYPSPPVEGIGSAATPEARQFVLNAATRQVTVRGSGSLSGTDDTCAMAAQAYRSSRGVFVCRVVSITGGAQASVPDGSKFGLMLRETLSGGAASIGLDIALNRGVHLDARVFAGGLRHDVAKSEDKSGWDGLLNAAAILGNNSVPAPNYLLRPVWLKLVLDIDRVTPFTSLDGTTWVQAGPQTVLTFVGAWVGVFAGDKAVGQYSTAVFDQISGFWPDTLVQIGSV